jgi:hypothetical protein
MKETNYTKNIKAGEVVIVNGIQIEVNENCGDGSFYGTDPDGGDIDFTTEQITAICP